MDKFVLVPYELKDKKGEIIVKEGTPIEFIEDYCIIDTIDKIDREKLKEQLKLGD